MRRGAGAVVLILLTVPCFAGGPLYVGGPTIGANGQPMVWDASVPIAYRVDSGPLSASVSNASALARVRAMFDVWQNVPGAALSFSYAGPMQATGAFGGGDVVTLSDYNAVRGACKAGEQTAIIFDANGTLMKALGLDQFVIGIAGPCSFSAAGKITSAFALLNGAMQDGINTYSNPEMTAEEFDESITHELGHFIGLDHSQVNLQLYSSANYENCPTDALAGMPLMFPVAFCQARSAAGLPMLSPDDAAWVAKLYPAVAFAASYGSISGHVLFSDGISAMQGVNVIARRVDDPATPQDESLRIQVSVVSGYLFTGNPGQSVTAKYLPCSPAEQCPGGYFANNSAGSKYGSRDPALIGYYEIPVSPGTYTVQVESISADFTGGSSVGPLDPPIPMPGTAAAHAAITVVAGQSVSGIDIIVTGTPGRFDQFEDGISFSLGSSPRIHTRARDRSAELEAAL